MTSTVHKALTLQAISPAVTSTVRRTLGISTKTTTATQLSGGGSAQGMGSGSEFRKVLVTVMAAWVALAALLEGKRCLPSELDAGADDMVKFRVYDTSHSGCGRFNRL